ncbi:MAG: N-acetyltransferase [Candidatus Brocadiia bacterium]
MNFEILPVDRKSLKTFLKVPWGVYRGDPNWVPPLLDSVREMFNPDVHPFHKHSSVQPFLCIDDAGLPLGRICAIHNKRHLEFHQDGCGFFGFFETLNDPEIAGALLSKAQEWLQERGCTRARGPASFSTNEECGLLVKGFDSPPVVMMAYNPPYYSELIESAGYAKAMDVFAYRIDGASAVPERLARGAQMIARRRRARIRPLDFSKLDKEIELVFDIYNRAWELNWGFVPMTLDEFRYLTKELTRIADKELVLFVEIDGKPVGFSLALPDINFALKHVDGKLNPLSMIKLLWYARKIKALRILAMGVLKEYRGLGLDTLLYAETWLRGTAKGYSSGEMSWILETNHEMNTVLEKMGAARYKTYRFYEKAL